MSFDTCIIAECGTCHSAIHSDQRLDKAIEYVKAAHTARAGAIKFQIFDNPNPDTLFCWIEGDEERNERWRESRLSLDQWKRVKRECDEIGISFLASVFEYETVKWLTELEVEATKVASRAAAYLEEFRDAPKPLLVSNGMTEVVWIEGGFVLAKGKDGLVLECEANYPSTKRWSGKYPGFSDHSGSPWRAIDAIAKGCRMIEVHFYIDQKDAGPDLPASLTLDELKLVCDAMDAFNEM